MDLFNQPPVNSSGPDYIDDNSTIGDAKRWIHQHKHDAGTPRCPCCDRVVTVYKRRLNATIANQLVRAYQQAGIHWFYCGKLDNPKGAPALRVKPDTLTNGDFSKLEYWGFIERQDGKRNDGSRRMGVWRITERGRDWLFGRTTASEFCDEFLNDPLKFHGRNVRITDVIEGFLYHEIIEPT